MKLWNINDFSCVAEKTFLTKLQFYHQVLTYLTVLIENNGRTHKQSRTVTRVKHLQTQSRCDCFTVGSIAPSISKGRCASHALWYYICNE
jgi:hypothetical protein